MCVNKHNVNLDYTIVFTGIFLNHPIKIYSTKKKYCIFTVTVIFNAPQILLLFSLRYFQQFHIATILMRATYGHKLDQAPSHSWCIQLCFCQLLL